MTNSDTPPKTSSLYNVQPTSHTSKPETFPSLPFVTENLKFIIKCNFQFSDLKDNEYNTLCSSLLKNKTCYATQKNWCWQKCNSLSYRLKPNAQLITQRPSKVLIH